LSTLLADYFSLKTPGHDHRKTAKTGHFQAVRPGLPPLVAGPLGISKRHLRIDIDACQTLALFIRNAVGIALALA
jgi:hypothetical protein